MLNNEKGLMAAAGVKNFSLVKDTDRRIINRIIIHNN